MAHELTHREASELLGVYALDAVDVEERVAIEHHLIGCGLCRAEVSEHVEMAGLLSSGVAQAPMAVWDRISAELVEAPPPLDLESFRAQRPPARSAVPLPEAPGPAGPPAGPVVDRPSSGWGRGVRIGALVAAASVAASVIGVLGVRVVEDGRRIDEIASGAHGDKLERAIDAATVDPEAVKVEMRSPDGALFVDAWLLPDGRGYLARDNLPTLSPDRNYQMWAVVGENKISVGLLGSDPEPAAFVANGPVVALAITEEDAGGVVLSLQQPVVVGELRRA